MAWQFSSEHAERALGVRDEFVAALERLDPQVDTFVIKLIFTEVVANVVRHAPGPIELFLDADGDDFWLSVFDRGPQFEWNARLPEDPYVEGGRGLFLIDRYARKIVVERRPLGGNVVRIQL